MTIVHIVNLTTIDANQSGNLTVTANLGRVHGLTSGQQCRFARSPCAAVPCSNTERTLGTISRLAVVLQANGQTILQSCYTHILGLHLKEALSTNIYPLRAVELHH